MNFFAPLYELFGLAYQQSFSDDMYTNNIYAPIGVSMLLVALLSMVLYYFLLSNYGAFYKTKYYWLWLLAIGIVNFGIAFYLADNLLYEAYSPNSYPDGYVSKICLLSLINLTWSVVFSLLLSTVLKIKSIKASRTPF